MNIRLRLTLWYTVILALIVVAFSLMVYIGLGRSLIAAIDNHLQREAAQILGNLKFEPAKEREEEEGEEEEEEHKADEKKYAVWLDGLQIELNYIPEDGVFWRVLAANGQAIFDPGHFDGVPLISNLVQSGRIRLDYVTLANETPIRLYTVPFVIEQRGAGIIQVAESYQHIQDVQRQLLLLLALSGPFILLVTSAGGWFLAGRALAPIDRITRSAQQISADDLHQRLDLDLPNDEVGRLATTFDEMLARLEDAFERQKRFIADASHELRTPLTILKGDVEVALNRSRSIEEYQETLHMVNQTTDRLTALVEELFLLARADNNQYPLQIEPIDLSNLLAKQVSALQSQAAAKKILLHFEAPKMLPMRADPDKLMRLFINLIDNAIKYSGEGDTVSISATRQNGQARIAVADTGPGIPPEHLPHLFERFYRVDKARSRRDISANSSSGTGLGLSIARWLAEVHGGRIEVTSQLQQGTIFIIWLPLEPDIALKM